MSTRAYRIIKIELESQPSVNLSKQLELADFLGYYNDGGEFEVEVKNLKKLLNNDTLIKQFEIDQDQLAQLKKDLASADDDYIYYQAY